MKNIRENKLILKYSFILENELNKLINSPKELLYLVDNIIKNSVEWKFSKDGNILYPHPYFNEIMGYKTGKLTNKKFSSLQEASDKEFSIYGIAENSNHIVTIDSASSQFGSFLRCFVYDKELTKMLPIRLPKSYLKGNEFYFEKNSLPSIRNLVYFLWLDPENQIILSKGMNNKHILIDQLQYKDDKPDKYITNRIENNELYINLFSFIYKDNELEMIKHDLSEHTLYIK
uniref:hypothetical protein n=1 Tax=Ornithobacterium rhinotracheale TaxID=28251 RepID=UPI0039A73AA5